MPCCPTLSRRSCGSLASSCARPPAPARPRACRRPFSTLAWPAAAPSPCWRRAASRRGRPPAAWRPSGTARAAVRLFDRTPGDLLVFLPGLQEIRQTARQLEQAAQERDLMVLPLYGDLPAEQQDAALLPLGRRKIVLATNVAETSVTVEGITGVIDTGLAPLLGFDARVGLDRLRVTPISRPSADQGAGRPGRTQPG